MALGPLVGEVEGSERPTVEVTGQVAMALGPLAGEVEGSEHPTVEVTGR